MIPTEHQEQCTVNRYCEVSKIPMFAIPNGANKSKTAQKMFKSEGLKSGVPDLMIPLSNNKYHGLFIEMKRIKGGTVSENQKDWIEKLNNNGYYAVICKGAKEAISVIEKYLKGDI